MRHSKQGRQSGLTRAVSEGFLDPSQPWIRIRTHHNHAGHTLQPGSASPCRTRARCAQRSSSQPAAMADGLAVDLWSLGCAQTSSADALPDLDRPQHGCVLCVAGACRSLGLSIGGCLASGKRVWRLCLTSIRGAPCALSFGTSPPRTHALHRPTPELAGHTFMVYVDMLPGQRRIL